MLYETVMWICLLVLCLIIIFYCVCILCDDHLVPAIDVIIQQFKIPEEVAAVTLVAFGSACPEIILNSIGAIEGKSSLSLPACLGSGIIAFGLIPPLCVIMNNISHMTLSTAPILREAFFYCIALLLFLKAFQDGVVTIIDASLLVSVYFIYIGIVLFAHLSKRSQVASQEGEQIDDGANIDSGLDIEKKRSALALESSANNSLATHIVPSGRPDMEVDMTDEMPMMMDMSTPLDAEGSGNALLTLKPSDDETVNHNSNDCCENDVCSSIVSNVRTFLEPLSHVPVIVQAGASLHNIHTMLDQLVGVPIQRILHSILPVLHTDIVTKDSNSTVDSPDPAPNYKDVSLIRVLVIFTMCIGLIGLFSSGIIVVCTEITAALGISNGTVGATLVSLGSEIPDIVASISLTKCNYPEAAMAGAIGSQVINLSLGVGVPLLFLAINSKHGSFSLGQESTSSLYLLTLTLLTVIMVHLCIVLPIIELVIYWYQCLVQKCVQFQSHVSNAFTASVNPPSIFTTHYVQLCKNWICIPTSSDVTELSYSGACVLCGVFCISYISFIVLNEDVVR